MISAALADFLTGRVDLQIGTRDAELRPHAARVTAIRVEDDSQHVVVFIPEVGLASVLPDLQANGHAAVVAARPLDHHTYQLKGMFVDVTGAEPADREFVERFWHSTLEALQVIGIDRAVFSHWPTWPSMAVRMRVTAVFSQTPGPGAGAQVP